MDSDKIGISRRKRSFVLKLVKCGKHTHTNTDKSKNYNVVDQVLDCMNMLVSGRLVVFDSVCVTKIYLKMLKQCGIYA